jgi:5-methylcytosine-specific restriction endonuclease McrA
VTRPRGVTLMNRYSLTLVSDSALLRDLRSLLAKERATTAELLAHFAEVDDRRLYAAAGHPSMFAWCVAELHLSEEAAFKRIRVARVARRFPVVFSMLADGRLHLSAVVLLAPCLTPENAEGLFAAATHQSKASIEQLLAARFPQPDLPARIEAFAPAPTNELSAPGRIEATDVQLSPGTVGESNGQLAPGTVKFSDMKLQAATVAVPSFPGTAHSRVAPLAPGRYAVQFTASGDLYEKLRYAQALLGHSLPTGELAEVFDRALDALIARLEQRKFAATSRPRQLRRPRRDSANPRHVPAEVRRAVWERDGGRCTFVSDAGYRCPARTRLEFDHVEPLARGGQATVKGMRLRCRAHNQHAAEREFGAGFMARKREAARREAQEARSRATAANEAARARVAAEAEAARVRAAAVEEVVPWLRALGLRVDEARRAAARSDTAPDAPLEERVRHALRCSARPSPACAAHAPRLAP